MKIKPGGGNFIQDRLIAVARVYYLILLVAVVVACFFKFSS
jgi:hypothetical protein